MNLALIYNPQVKFVANKFQIIEFDIEHDND